MTAGNEYGLRLFPVHAEMLAASAIDPAIASARGYVTVDTKQRLDGIGITPRGRNVPGLLVPLLRADGSTWGYQYRPDEPRERNGKAVKYETPTGQRNGIDVPPTVGSMLGNPDVPLFITEGSRKADAAASIGLACISIPGVWAWLGTNPKGGKVALSEWRDVALNGRRVILAFDSDVMGKESVSRALGALADYLATKGASVEYLHLPQATEGKCGFDDFIAAGNGVAEIVALIRPDRPEAIDPDEAVKPEVTPTTTTTSSGSTGQGITPVPMSEALAAFRRWLHMPDMDPVLAVAATVVANLSSERSPVWLLVIGPPSTGKTEVLGPVARLPQAHYAATITESALLSGTSRKERAADASGGLLRQIGDLGIIVMKDFGSVLSQHREARAQALAALREVYDGSWTRAVGTDGGRLLSWEGKCGLIAGGTTTYDRHHAVITSLGDRFLLIRLRDIEATAAGMAALSHAGREPVMRRELEAAFLGLIASTDASRVRALTDQERAELVRIARYAGNGRTGVERDGYTGELLVMPSPEGPGRLVVALSQMLAALWAIGCDDDIAWRIVRRIARDTVPALRTNVIDALMAYPDQPRRTADIAADAGLVTKTAHRQLDDLDLIGLADRSKSTSADNSPDLWAASPLLVDLYLGPESGTEKSVKVLGGGGVEPSPSYETSNLEEDISVSLSDSTVSTEPSNSCTHGMPGGAEPDPWLDGRLACPECAADLRGGAA